MPLADRCTSLLILRRHLEPRLRLSGAATRHGSSPDTARRGRSTARRTKILKSTFVYFLSMLAPVMRRLVRTRLGHRALLSAAVADPQTAVEAAGFVMERRRSFTDVKHWPDGLDGFEDCNIVFSSNDANHGIAQLTFEEGAHLFRLIRTTPGPHVEIGRYKGGGTFIMAAALRAHDELFSYDTLEKANADVDLATRLALCR